MPKCCLKRGVAQWKNCRQGGSPRGGPALGFATPSMGTQTQKCQRPPGSGAAGKFICDESEKFMAEKGAWNRVV
jgi:hypothetical protein